jgi:hypothetical protein
MTRKLARFLLASCLAVIPAVAQRGGGGFQGRGGGFHGGGFAGPGFRGGFGNRGFGGFRGGFFPGNRFFFGFGFPGYWPYYGGGWGYPYYNYYSYPYYSTYSYPYAYPSPYDSGYAYGSPGQNSCLQANGRLLYQIKLTNQSNIWLAQEYWYTAGTLNFITLQGELKKTPINSIDRAITFQLNLGCGVIFQLPHQLPK